MHRMLYESEIGMLHLYGESYMNYIDYIDYNINLIIKQLIFIN